MTGKQEVLIKKNKKNRPLRVLVTAGPTRAYLDRVRFLSNYSTGELGYLLSKALSNKGIEVFAVVGPTQQAFSKLSLKRLIEVETADEMLEATLKLCRTFQPDYAIFSAAVLDFKPVETKSGKVTSRLKKWNLQLVPAPKIIDQVGRLYPLIRRIGFKLEWEPKTGKALNQFADRLLDEKKLDAVCINFLPQISRERHPLWIFTRTGRVSKCNTKVQAAEALADFVRSRKTFRSSGVPSPCMASD